MSLGNQDRMASRQMDMGDLKYLAKKGKFVFHLQMDDVWEENMKE
jgi:signal recognition particle GTPase